jgi:hypothetical protein
MEMKSMTMTRSTTEPADARLRLLALSQGRESDQVSIEEIRALLVARIASRSRITSALRNTKEAKKKKKSEIAAVDL